MCYNHSCLLVGKGDLKEAEEKLKKAEGKLHVPTVYLYTGKQKNKKTKL